MFRILDGLLKILILKEQKKFKSGVKNLFLEATAKPALKFVIFWQNNLILILKGILLRGQTL